MNSLIFVAIVVRTFRHAVTIHELLGSMVQPRSNPTGSVSESLPVRKIDVSDYSVRWADVGGL